MVSETVARPKPVYLWTKIDVKNWFDRHCGASIEPYLELFHQHDITGRVLLRLNDNSLLRMGIRNDEHRELLWREILKLRLKTDIMEIRDFEFMNMYFE